MANRRYGEASVPRRIGDCSRGRARRVRRHAGETGVTRGFETELTVRAYPFPAVEEDGVVNDSVGDLPVVVAAKSGVQAELFAYDRRLSGELLWFEPAGEGLMRAGSSLWEVPTGRALDGPYRDQRLTRAGTANAVFWFAWLDFHPETDVYDAGT